MIYINEDLKNQFEPKKSRISNNKNAEIVDSSAVSNKTKYKYKYKYWKAIIAIIILLLLPLLWPIFIKH